ncbi:AGC family protein kinase [Trichomonas vaginalis G3]|uniref:non-specific serine/threonine protein kinase n=1 Tax=Trichomonas vaginalis (strain ATCC PRA-98 / G3) TaxID=412133 RepID=A2EEV7_TRIV3|nr:clathrin-coated pit assembly [Trichomonas vaginalis G3]EAY08823.1 AGC family protein kinase [Trichomonas vaginalis G3]KAI5542050.1 clathrin-coated pit assembly [Trichomonas vaginalis G3]|eukprot:XP_001321046.1 AGC family protein kinase [Trichomonas vaginalis G3]
MSGASQFIGKTLTIGKHTVTVKEQIGEGGYAWVYRVVDAQGQEYAWKYVNCLSREKFLQFKKEADVLQSIPPHKHIIKLFDVSYDQNRFIINFLFELAPQTAINILSKRNMTREEILIFFAAICEATAFLHAQNPPIIHRDLKPENLLVASDGIPRLCDFGSATTKIYQVANVKEINEASDDIEQNTTPNFRAPEMVDLYKRVPIGPAADVWALGCTLYKLVFRQDLYKIEERLPILQGKLNIPPDTDKDFANLLKMCIQVDAKRRPTAARLAEIATNLRGDKTTIALPPKRVDPPAGAPRPSGGAPQAQEGGVMGWFSSIQETFRSVVAQGSEGWVVKATFGDNNPPVSKYVRRIIVDSIRHTNVDVNQITDFILTQRPWQSDARIAAKCLYLVSLLTQYQANLTSLVPVTVKTDQIMAFFSQGRSDESMKGAVSVINGLCVLLRTKLMLHAAHPELEGNLYIADGKTSDKLPEDAVKYAKAVIECSRNLLKSAKAAKDFSAIVMCQPAIDETLHAARLLNKVSPEQGKDAIEDALKLLNEAQGLPYLASAIDYPESPDKLGVPTPRFVAAK